MACILQQTNPKLRSYVDKLQGGIGRNFTATTLYRSRLGAATAEKCMPHQIGQKFWPLASELRLVETPSNATKLELAKLGVKNCSSRFNKSDSPDPPVIVEAFASLEGRLCMSDSPNLGLVLVPYPYTEVGLLSLRPSLHKRELWSVGAGGTRRVTNDGVMVARSSNITCFVFKDEDDVVKGSKVLRRG
ncbi:hypothetical protein T265_00334 [Opisthorchis viverrini]|uniref:Uncharacterized protein n=1 Tax=Opisthorchis viverrini TaxID=6198 RepID=A0A075A3E0_OPIVI|nr:hypothetical protein T265_00334 [Opisthorchis viverrini]KER33891.1 hypothetical protein T265_00334 [Opisthorchis viverrini]